VNAPHPSGPTGVYNMTDSSTVGLGKHCFRVMRLHEALPRVRYHFMELNINGIMARIPVLGVVDYGLEFQVLKRLAMFLYISCIS
jgi:hypothetical protein